MPIAAGYDGKPVRKVSVDKARERMVQRGFLAVKDGKIPSGERVMFLRARERLIGSGEFAGEEGLPKRSVVFSGQKGGWRGKRSGRKAMAKAKAAKRAKPQRVERRALTIADFCEAYQISPEYYFKMRKQRKGPREMKLGSSKRITLRAAEQWEIEREKDAATEDRRVAANAAASS